MEVQSFDLFICQVLDWGFKVLKCLVSGFKISPFNNFSLVSLLKVLLWICLIIIKLASPLKIWFFIAKWCEADQLYTHPYGGCSVLNWNLFQPYLHIVCDTSYILQKRWQNCKWLVDDLVENCKYPSILLALKWMCVLYL